MTRTYALLEISEAAWQEIHDKLDEAGRMVVAKNGEIDMHGIALVREDPPVLDKYELLDEESGKGSE